MPYFTTVSGFLLGFMIIRSKEFRDKFVAFQVKSFAVYFLLALVFCVYFFSLDGFSRYPHLLEELKEVYRDSEKTEQVYLDLDRQFVRGLVMGLLMAHDASGNPWMFYVHLAIAHAASYLYYVVFFSPASGMLDTLNKY